MKVTGITTKLQGMESRLSQMARSTKASDSMTFTMAKGSSLGQMDQSMKAHMNKDSKMAKANFIGLMTQNTKVNSTWTIFKAKVSSLGLIRKDTMANGKRTRCMDMAPFHDQRCNGNTKATTEMERKMARESSPCTTPIKKA